MVPTVPTSVRLDPLLRKRLESLVRQRGLGAVIDDGLRELLARSCPTCGSLRPARSWRRYFRDEEHVRGWAQQHRGEAAYIVVDYGHGPRAYKGRVAAVTDGHRIGQDPFPPRTGRGRILLAEYVVDAVAGVPHNDETKDFEQEHPGIPVEPWPII